METDSRRLLPFIGRNWGLTEQRQAVAPGAYWRAAAHPTWLVPRRSFIWGVTGVRHPGARCAVVPRQPVPLLAQLRHHVLSTVVDAHIHLFQLLDGSRQRQALS